MNSNDFGKVVQQVGAPKNVQQDWNAFKKKIVVTGKICVETAPGALMVMMIYPSTVKALF